MTLSQIIVSAHEHISATHGESVTDIRIDHCYPTTFGFLVVYQVEVAGAMSRERALYGERVEKTVKWGSEMVCK